MSTYMEGFYVIIFSGMNYQLWADSLQAVLMYKDLWRIVLNGPIKRKDESDVEFEQRQDEFLRKYGKENTMVLGMMAYTMAPAFKRFVLDQQNAAVCWERLKRFRQYQ